MPEVVDLPCEPATARHWRGFASIPRSAARFSSGMPAARAAAISGLVSRAAAVATTRSAPGDVRRCMTDSHVDAERSKVGRRLAGVHVRATDTVATAVQHACQPGDPSATNADEVHARAGGSGSVSTPGVA